MKPEELLVTNHCVVRFVERVLGFDFTDLKLQYMLEKSIPSIRLIDDKNFVQWIDKQLNVNPFRKQVIDFISPNMSENQLKIIKNNPKRNVFIFVDKFKFIIYNRKIITVTLANLRNNHV